MACLEIRQQFRELGCFIGKPCTGSIHLFDHCGILLRGLIHMIDGDIDFAKPHRLLLGGCRDGIHMCIDLLDHLRDGTQALTGIVDQLDSSETATSEFPISCLISFAALAERWASSRTS